MDTYHHMGFATLPKYFSDAEKLIHEDSLNQHGILPWHIFHMQKSLTKAMQAKDAQAILHLASDLGHYIADANVPLHTTHNYDGQFTNQKGIHALWETRVPELYAKKYDYLIGKAEYIQDVQAHAWKTVQLSHNAVDSVLSFESALSKDIKTDEKYAFEERNHTTIRVYSRAFALQYSNALQGQVERKMRSSIKMVADLWYTSWIEAGQPDFSTLIEKKNIKESAEKEAILDGQSNCEHQHKPSTKTLPTMK
ncbi:MAG TPA: S1/P1 Nuclease [Cytophagales bacterium]|nr:S1/P1 Nuclease [Cytophagales bacterium]